MSANSAVLSKDKSHLRIPKITPSGEVMLIVDLAAITNHTPEQVEAIAIALGYTPTLRIAEYVREGKPTLEPVLLIYHGNTQTDSLLDHWEQLAAELQPSTAVHLRSGLPLAT